MLLALSIKNIVLIDQLNLELSEGLSALSGETGAGKSILLDALTLALGGRGEKSLVRAGEKSGTVVAEIILPKNHPAQLAIEAAGIEAEDQLVLKRLQYYDGRTRGFINDQPVSASLMRKIGSMIVEIHGQHDDRALVDGATHRVLLDVFGGLENLAQKLQNLYQQLVIADEAVAVQQAKIEKARQDEEYARHVVEELSALAMEAGEEEKLSAQRQKLMQLEKAADEVNDCDEILNGKSSPASNLASLMRRLARKSDSEMALFSPVIEALDASLLALDRTGEALEDIKRQMIFDPLDLENAEERLFALRAMAKKHNVMCEQLPDILARYKGELEELNSGEENLAALIKQAQKARNQYLQIAEDLSAKRAKTIMALEKSVAKELPDLKLGAAKFIVDHKIEEGRVSPSGFDNIAFHVQTNPGTKAGPMMKVASGGELSRFLLALKVVLAEKGSAPVLIFDEIDTGVGGAVADAIGRRLARLAKQVQVICVTHAPQVAVRAKNHMLIEKQLLADGKAMRTHVKLLSQEPRLEEVARMLSGEKISDEARAAAKQLLSEG